MVLKCRQEHIKPKTDKHGKYYELRFFDKEERIHKIYFRDHDNWIDLKLKEAK